MFWQDSGLVNATKRTPDPFRMRFCMRVSDAFWCVFGVSECIPGFFLTILESSVFFMCFGTEHTGVNYGICIFLIQKKTHLTAGP